MLIDVASLAARLADVTLLDARWNLLGPPAIGEYRDAHIPGAVFADIDTDLAAPPGRGGRHPLPDGAAFQDAMRRLGVRNDRAVVAYDATGGVTAARVWWLLRHHGHDDVYVLDGGLPGWVAAGHPTVGGDETNPPGDFVAQPGRLSVVDAEEAAAIARTGVLLDVRAAERYRGEVEPIDRIAGHVPGAVSAPTMENAPDATWLPLAALRARFAAVGADGSRPLAAYCGSGVNGSQTVLALHLLGIECPLYAGSYSEWVADETRPVVIGADPG